MPNLLGQISFLREAGNDGRVLENHDNYGKSDIVVQKGLVTKYDKRGMDPDLIWIRCATQFSRKEASRFYLRSRWQWTKNNFTEN